MRFNDKMVIIPESRYRELTDLETIVELRRQFYSSVDSCKEFKTPLISESHSHEVYDAFEEMHRQDGTKRIARGGKQ